MKRLDRSRPYASVHGTPVAMFEQDDILFDLHGFPVGSAAEELDTPAEEPEAKEGFAGKPWRELKALVEQYDGVYTSKEAAIAFLEGKS